MTGIRVNNGRADCLFDIDRVEQHYNATYVGQFCLKHTDGSWVDGEVPVFYVAAPTHPDHSNYFALFVRAGRVMITNASSAVEVVISGIQADDGEIIYSRYVHDCRWSADGTVMIDGGRDYCRVSTTGSPSIPISSRLVQLTVEDGQLIVHRESV